MFETLRGSRQDGLHGFRPAIGVYCVKLIIIMRRYGLRNFCDSSSHNPLYSPMDAEK